MFFEMNRMAHGLECWMRKIFASHTNQGRRQRPCYKLFEAMRHELGQFNSPRTPTAIDPHPLPRVGGLLMPWSRRAEISFDAQAVLMPIASQRS
jgi:hypothetical protein